MCQIQEPSVWHYLVVNVLNQKVAACCLYGEASGKNDPLRRELQCPSHEAVE